MFHGEAEVAEEVFCRSGFTESGHTDDAAIQPDVLPPPVRGLGFQRDAGAYSGRQYGFPVSCFLPVEDFAAGHGYHAHAAALCFQRFGSVNCQFDF